MTDFSVPFMIVSILLLVCLGGMGFFWFVSRQLDEAIQDKNRQLAKKTREVEQFKKLAGAWDLPNQVPTLKELTDLTMRLHGQPSPNESVDRVINAGTLTADGVELSRIEVKKIPICFSYSDFITDPKHIDEINEKLKEAIGPQISAHRVDSGRIQFRVEGEGFLYTGPVLLSADYHDTQQTLELLQRAAFMSSR